MTWTIFVIRIKLCIWTYEYLLVKSRTVHKFSYFLSNVYKLSKETRQAETPLSIQFYNLPLANSERSNILRCNLLPIKVILLCSVFTASFIRINVKWEYSIASIQIRTCDLTSNHHSVIDKYKI